MANIWTASDRNLDNYSRQVGDVGAGETFTTAVEDAFKGGASKLLWDYSFDTTARVFEQPVAKEEAEAKIKAAGVQLNVPERGLTPTQLDTLIQRKFDENRRKMVLGSGEHGGVAFAGQLLGSLVDPLNIAAAFIPVVGEARYAQLLANASGALGRAGVRAGVGAIEGLVGTAVLEPGVYATHQYFQDDYKASDSLLNVMFGAAMGATIHAGGGFIADKYRAYAGKAQPWERTDFNQKMDGATRTTEQVLEEANAPRISHEMHETAFRAQLAADLDGRISDPAAVLRQEIDTLKARAGDPEAAARAASADPIADARLVGERTYSPEGVAGADHVAAREADETLKLYGEKDLIDIVNEETQTHLKAAQDMADQLDVRSHLESDLEAAKASAAESDVFSKAIEAAATCRMRT